MTETSTSAQDRAYAQIRELIVAGELAPGSRVHERDISTRLGLSRTPVREAVRRLSSEGLIRSEPHRGAFIEEVDLQMIDEIFDIGAVLESRCARLAVRKMGPGQVSVMADLYGQMEALLAAPSDDLRARYLELDKAFHGVLIDATGNRQLQAIVRQAISLPVLMRAFQQYAHEDFARSLTHHEEILAAVRTGDAEWAELAMRNHILASRNLVIFQSGPEDKPANG